MSDLSNITAFSGLTITSDQTTGTSNRYATFAVSNVTTAQRDLLENVTPYTVNGTTVKIKEGTIIFNIDVKALQIFRSGQWENANTNISTATGAGLSSSPFSIPSGPRADVEVAANQVNGFIYNDTTNNLIREYINSRWNTIYDTYTYGRCMLSSSNTTISTANNTWIALAFNGTNQTTYDPNNWHSNTTNNTRITPGVIGTYRLTGSIHYDNDGDGVTCGIGFGVNNINPTESMLAWFARDTTTGRRCATFTCIYTTTQNNDYFQMYGNQDSGGVLGLQGFHFQVERLV
jgi:hypothetical protein